MNFFKPAGGREHKKLNIVFGSMAFALLIAATYLTLTHHPFAVTLNKWQANMMGDNKYFPALTIFLLALPQLLFLLLLKMVLLQLIKK